MGWVDKGVERGWVKLVFGVGLAEFALGMGWVNEGLGRGWV